MKVLLRTDRDNVSVCEIPAGQAFVYKDLVYMKVEAIEKDFPSVSLSLNTTINAVNLVTGRLTHFGTIDKVYPLNLEVREITGDTSWGDYD